MSGIQSCMNRYQGFSSYTVAVWKHNNVLSKQRSEEIKGGGINRTVTAIQKTVHLVLALVADIFRGMRYIAFGGNYKHFSTYLLHWNKHTQDYRLSYDRNTCFMEYSNTLEMIEIALSQYEKDVKENPLDADTELFARFEAIRNQLERKIGSDLNGFVKDTQNIARAIADHSKVKTVAGMNLNGRTLTQRHLLTNGDHVNVSTCRFGQLIAPLLKSQSFKRFIKDRLKQALSVQLREGIEKSFEEITLIQQHSNYDSNMSGFLKNCSDIRKIQQLLDALVAVLRETKDDENSLKQELQNSLNEVFTKVQAEFQKQFNEAFADKITKELDQALSAGDVASSIRGFAQNIAAFRDTAQKRLTYFRGSVDCTPLYSAGYDQLEKIVESQLSNPRIDLAQQALASIVGAFFSQRFVPVNVEQPSDLNRSGWGDEECKINKSLPTVAYSPRPCYEDDCKVNPPSQPQYFSEMDEDPFSLDENETEVQEVSFALNKADWNAWVLEIKRLGDSKFEELQEKIWSSFAEKKQSEQEAQILSMFHTTTSRFADQLTGKDGIFSNDQNSTIVEFLSYKLQEQIKAEEEAKRDRLIAECVSTIGKVQSYEELFTAYESMEGQYDYDIRTAALDKSFETVVNFVGSTIMKKCEGCSVQEVESMQERLIEEAVTNPIIRSLSDEVWEKAAPVFNECIQSIIKAGRVREERERDLAEIKTYLSNLNVRLQQGDREFDEFTKSGSAILRGVEMINDLQQVKSYVDRLQNLRDQSADLKNTLQAEIPYSLNVIKREATVAQLNEADFVNEQSDVKEKWDALNKKMIECCNRLQVLEISNIPESIVNKLHDAHDILTERIKSVSSMVGKLSNAHNQFTSVLQNTQQVFVREKGEMLGRAQGEKANIVDEFLALHNGKLGIDDNEDIRQVKAKRYDSVCELIEQLNQKIASVAEERLEVREEPRHLPRHLPHFVREPIDMMQEVNLGQ